MDPTNWVNYGESRGKILDAPGGCYHGTIEVHDLGDDNFVGVRYPDTARQMQPIAWWKHHHIERKLEEFRKERARGRIRLNQGVGGPLQRPRLRPSALTSPSRSRMGLRHG